MPKVVCGLKWAAVIVFCALIAWPASSSAQGFPNLFDPKPLNPDSLNAGAGPYEARLGIFAHGVGSEERGSVDIGGQFVFPRLWTASTDWNWLIPRPHVGFIANTAGRTSYFYGGALWTYNVTPRFFAEGFLGGAIHNGSLEGDATHVALGCRTLFHVGGSVGYRLSEKWSVLATFEHVSNGNAVLNACSNNVGLNEYGVRVGYSF